MYDTTTTILEQALKLAKRGFAVFPVHGIVNGKCTCNRDCGNDAGKHPATAHGFNDGTTDPETIKQLFKNKPNHNIGIATGFASDCFVIDADNLTVFDAIATNHEPIATLTATSGRSEGGKHLFFRYVDEYLKNSTKVLGCLDVRSDGGYVVAPPSNHESGKRYQWEDESIPIADCPVWLFDSLPRRKAAKSVTGSLRDPKPNDKADTKSYTIHDEIVARIASYAKTVDPAIQGQGGRNVTFRLFCYVVGKFPDADDDQILRGVYDWNQTCSPPWNEYGKRDSLQCKINEAREHVAKQQNETGNGSGCVVSDIETVDRPVMNPKAYHGIAGEAVRLIEPHTDCDPSAVYLQLLTLAGCCIGHNVSFDVGRKQYANLFSCIVGESAEARKGTSLYVAKQLLKNVTDKPETLSGIGSGEGLVDAIKDVETKIKDNGEVIVIDGTDDKRCVVEATEFGSILKVLKREGNTLSPILRNAWDSDTIRSVTKGSKLAATDPHVSIIAHVTTSELLKMMKGSDELANGFANRFLWSFAIRSKRITLPIPIDEIDGIETIRKRLAETIENAKRIRTVTLSDEARTVYENEYDRLTRHRSGLYGKVSQRAIAQMMRLALILTLLDGSTTIDASHIHSAIAIWDYLDASARYVFDIGDDDEENTLMKAVLTKIKANPGKPKWQYKRNGHTTASELQHALDCLISAGHVNENNGRYYPGPSKADPEPQNASATSAPRRGADPEPKAAKVTTTEPKAETAKVTIPATVGELFDYRNTHPELRFVRDDEGNVSLESTEPIPDAITLAVANNQALVTNFVSEPITDDDPAPITFTIGEPIPEPVYDHDSIVLADEEFYDDLVAMNEKEHDDEKKKV